MLLPIVNILNDYNICENFTSYPTTLISLRSDKNLSGKRRCNRYTRKLVIELPCNLLSNTRGRQCKEDAYKNMLCLHF